MTIALESMAVAMPKVAGHPNRTDFRGVLTMVDIPSQRAPSGSRGRLVVLTKKAAEAALPSLLGMALDYAPSFDRHDVRRKVGVITQAEIVGRKLEIGGYLYAKDFPEIVEEIAKSEHDGAVASGSLGKLGPVEAAAVRPSPEWVRELPEDMPNWKSSLSVVLERMLYMTTAAQGPGKNIGLHASTNLQTEAESSTGGPLGMSYEVTGVELADPRARVWTLTKVTFTGAAILRRDKAAYPNTWIALGS